MFNWIRNQNKYFLLFLSSVVFLLFVGLAAPLFSNFLENDKDLHFEEKLDGIKEETQKEILSIETKLVKSLTLLTDYLAESGRATELIDIISSEDFESIGVGIYDKSNNIIAWNDLHSLKINDLENLLINKVEGESFFWNSPLISWLSIFDESSEYIIYLSIPLEKHYKIRNEHFSPLNLSHDLSIRSNSELKIIYNINEYLENTEKPKFLFPIKNAKSNVIGYTRVKSINVNEDLEKFKNLVLTIQSALAFASFIFLGLWLFTFLIDSKYVLIKTFLAAIYIVGIRILVFIFDIPNKVGFAEINNPIYFSSKFAYGVVSSPAELFLTILSGILILFIFYRYLLQTKKEKNSKSYSNVYRLLITVTISVVFFIVLRMFGATIRSVVFDSSILYFKDTVIFADLSTTFMFLNILLVGIGFVLLAIIPVIVLLRVLEGASAKSNYKIVVEAILFLQLFGFVFDFIQPNPQTSWFVRVIFIIIVPLIAFFIEFTKASKYSIIIALLFSGSFSSISLLSYFNLEQEKRSMKIIATDMSRSSLSLLDFYADEIIYKILDDDDFKKRLLSENTNFDSKAFVLWSNSALSRDAKKSILNIVSPQKDLLGSFNYEFDEPFIWDWNNGGNEIGIQKVYQDIENSENKIIRVIAPIEYEKRTIGFIEISILYDVYSFGFEKSERFLSSSDLISNLSINPNFLKIFKFRNGELVNYFTDVLLSDPEVENLLNIDFRESNEVWITTKLNKEYHTVYLGRTDHSNSEELIVVGLRDKDFTWNLYNFFKVFFIHSILIFIILLVIAIINIRKLIEASISFRMKILLSLIVVSVLPIVLLAVYFKDITVEKNSDAVYYKLGKRADSVDEYINNYFYNSSLSEAAIFDKAVSDLGVHFSIFNEEELLYSSEGVYYNAGLLPTLLNAEVFNNFFYKGENEYVVKEKFEKFSFNSFYSKIEFGNRRYIISVNDAFNKIQLPMTGTELNIFLFGTYSLAILLIILLSTILANQISAPIVQMTKATKSVGGGDLEIQIVNSSKGEIKELIDGFNNMVKELKRNQQELAEVERESAWKEMAKQVAHEIKNPLTPMKLSVQHLISTYKDKSNKFDEIFSKVTSTLITQIDNLTSIASEFSSFAKMPSIKLSDFDLINLCKESADLFIEEDCEIHFHSEINELIVHSDNEQFQRMIINLIRNSIQAEASRIDISITNIEKTIEISIKDNGKGIDEKIIGRIFEENVTTKIEGMGLGLTLAKRFLDVTNGTIYIKDTSTEGTEVIINIQMS